MYRDVQVWQCEAEARVAATSATRRDEELECCHLILQCGTHICVHMQVWDCGAEAGVAAASAARRDQDTLCQDRAC